MGDIADHLTEQGEDQWHRHLHGQCGEDPCQYCEEDEAAEINHNKLEEGE
jgi:hypothetical protein